MCLGRRCNVGHHCHLRKPLICGVRDLWCPQYADEIFQVDEPPVSDAPAFDLDGQHQLVAELRSQLKVCLQQIWKTRLFVSFVLVLFIGVDTIMVYSAIFPAKQKALFFLALPLFLPIIVVLLTSLISLFRISAALESLPRALTNAKIRIASQQVWQTQGLYSEDGTLLVNHNQVGAGENEAVLRFLDGAIELVSSDQLSRGVTLFGFTVNSSFFKVVATAGISVVFSQLPLLLSLGQ
mmetsp:Transcript_17346/g.24313  ORF Transcript_17346/g.24313 Transcript_17346/m.24313 type:complete len:238 (-) Transcript_17346:156-869(-)